MKRFLIGLIVLLVSNSILTVAIADSGPTILITSPISGSSQKGIVTISGTAKPDPAGSAHIIEVGINIVGLSTSSGFSTRGNIVLVEKGQTSDVASWSFGDAGMAVAFWNPPDDPEGKFNLSFDTTSWPNQTYQVTLFAKDSNERSTASSAIRFIKSRSAISTVSAKVVCGGLSYVTVKVNYSLRCTSTRHLPELPIKLQYLHNGSWTTIDSNASIAGKVADYQFSFNTIGYTSVRLVSNGLMKQLSPYSENLQVRPFTSNSVSILVQAKPIERPQASQSPTVQKKPSGETSTSTNKRIPAPAIVGLSHQYIIRNSRAFPGVRFSFPTDLRYDYSIACRVAGQATVVRQTPEPGTLIRVNSTVSGYLDC
jgi:hypothetical protein